MPRPSALSVSTRLTDHISLGVIARTFPLDRIQSILAATGTTSQRQRELPAHVVVYYTIALALYMSVSTREVLRYLLEGLRWLWGTEQVLVASKSGISQARTRLGEKPLQQLYAQLVQPVATRATRAGRGIAAGAW
jgi:Insertion element 4 transposase N-terminal